MVAVALVALLAREYFVLANVPEAMIRGDIRQYVAYAWNLVHHGVFSVAQPGSENVVADAYRGPGYPILLAIPMVLTPMRWYDIAIQMNVLFGVITCVALMALVQRWLGVVTATVAGLMLALWPHHVSATSALLSEVALGAVLSIATLGLSAALRGDIRRSRWLAAISGVGLGGAELINPVVAPFIALTVVIAWWKRGRTMAVWLLIGALLPIAPWVVRNHTLPPTDEVAVGRAALNFVQGSWPDYHNAHRAVLARDANREVGQRILDAIDAEALMLQRDPFVGAKTIAARFAEHPRGYAVWYLFQKPWALWDWNIQLGAGGVHVHAFVPAATTLERHAGLRAIGALLHRLNAPLFASAILCVLVTTWRTRRDVGIDPVPLLLATLFVSLTAVHAVFQAEPRYATAYRWIQIALALGGIQIVAAWTQTLRHRSGESDAPQRI